MSAAAKLAVQSCCVSYSQAYCAIHCWLGTFQPLCLPRIVICEFGTHEKSHSSFCSLDRKMGIIQGAFDSRLKRLFRSLLISLQNTMSLFPGHIGHIPGTIFQYFSNIFPIFSQIFQQKVPSSLDSPMKSQPFDEEIHRGKAATQDPKENPRMDKVTPRIVRIRHLKMDIFLMIIRIIMKFSFLLKLFLLSLFENVCSCSIFIW